MDVNLKKEENLKDFYYSEYKNKIDDYYRNIKGNKYKIIIFRAIVMIALYVIIILMSSVLKSKVQEIENYYYIGLFLSLCMIFIATLISIYKSLKNENKKINEYIIEDLIAFASGNKIENVKYDTNLRLSEESFDKMELFDLNNVEYDGKNFISVTYNGNYMAFSDIEVYTLNELESKKEVYKNGKRYIQTVRKKVKKHIFKGLYIGARLNKKISNQIYLIPNNIKDSFVQKNINKYVKYKGNKLNLENLEFSKKYKVYSEDEVQARYILSLSLMEKINKIDDLFNGKKYIVFKEGRRFAICIEDFSIEDLKKKTLPIFRNETKEFEIINFMFNKINDLFKIYHILDLENNLYNK